VDRRKTLMASHSTLITILYAINNYNKYDKDTLIDEYCPSFKFGGAGNALNSDNILVALLKALNQSYHSSLAQPTDVSGTAAVRGPSQNRPIGHYDDLKSLRQDLNPVEGKGAIKYICEIMHMETGVKNSVSDPKVNHYGIDALHASYGKIGRKPNAAEAKALLYNDENTGGTGVTGLFIGALPEKLINTGADPSGIGTNTNIVITNSLFSSSEDNKKICIFPRL